VGAVMLFGSALFALLPTLARSVSPSAIGYGLLLGCFGSGAILGALILQPARSRWSTEVVVSAGVAILGMAVVAAAGLHRLSTLGPVMLVGGAAWIVFISLIRARVLAVYILISQGSMAIGSAAWGVVAQRAGIRAALVCAGIGTIATTALVLFAKLPDSTSDLSPWNHWRMPVLVKGDEADLQHGPVLVTVEYIVSPGHQARFAKESKNTDGCDVAMARTDGESSMTPKSQIAILRYFW
jgi:hypothetical protein